MQALLNAAAISYASAPPLVRALPSIPILYFGDHPAYAASALRIVTVALNPSSREFPTATPFLRFPAATGVSGSALPAPASIRSALDSYFKVSPYMGWFDSLEPVLSGFGASFLSNKPNTALHTDLLSPVATHPTWTKLARNDRGTLAVTGTPLWHQLIETLRPHIILISVAKQYIANISFRGAQRLSVIHTFSGKARYPLRHALISIDSTHSADLLFATAAQKPFGFYSNLEKQSLGMTLKGRLQHW